MLSSSFFYFFPLCASSSTYQCFISFDFSSLLSQVSHRGFFVLPFFFFFCKVRLFISFISSSIFFFFFGLDFSFTIQTLCQPNLEFQLIFIEGFLIERVRRGFLVWENDPIPKSKQCCIGKKNREESPKWCRLRLETKDPCEPLELVMVHRTGQSDCGPYGSLLFLYVTVLHV